ncbi:MAG: hypothetical protein H6712_31440 [Myxococcales bacterium]|nr:hypothetical protein [Myxococcales bacterium]MCB9718405.1 hypothetical protein [Myxococcales bacterium]
MSEGARDVDLLLVHADELDPVLESPLVSAGAGQGDHSRAYEEPEHLWDESRDANELDTQRWGVIAPEGPRGDELLGRIDRLIAHRREQQGGREVGVHRVPPRMDAAEAARWRKEVLEGPHVRRRDVPRYLLVLGELDEVSLELQVILGSEGYVGRLAFDRAEDYEAYADKLLRWEGAPAAIPRARAVFHTVRDRSSATTVGHRSLMQPGLALARSYHDEGDFLASELVEVDHGYVPKPGPLVTEVAKPEPGLLFTISHGAGAPRQGWGSTDEQRQLQGGMSFGRTGGLLSGEALRGRPFLPGGVWFMMACFGAGTPHVSKYEPWLRNLKDAGRFSGSLESVPASLPADGRPFTAAVPKAVLASADGPLAFIGHVDLAWTYSFRELDGQRPVDRPDRFLDVFSGLLRHDRVGVAFRELLRHYGRANTELTALVESGVDDPERRGHLWMLRNDLAGYVLLGDPAARLPIQPQLAARPVAPLDPYVALGLSPPSGMHPPPSSAAAPAPEAIAAPPVDPEALERAIGLLLAGEMGTNKILRECQLDLGRRELEELAERYAAAGRRALGLRLG